jgi:TRAP-type C4-dicarboxylate transport system substrate-binding protein
MSVLLLALLVVTVSACGSSHSATTTSATTAPASTETTAAQMQGDPVELKMASMHAPTALSGLDLEAWAEKIKQASNGLLTIRHYGSSQLVQGPEMRSGIKAGVADIGSSFIFSDYDDADRDEQGTL